MEKVKQKINKRKRSRNLFFAAIVALPLLQFCVFYIYVNFESIILAFRTYEPKLDSFGYDVSFAGTANFEWAIEKMKTFPFLFTNALKIFLIGVPISFVLALMFSFYLYKKYFASGVFKVILFLPQIISGLIFAVLFKYMVTDVYQTIVLKVSGKEVLGLLDNPDTRFGTLIFFNIWISFGVRVLMFSGSMSGIDPSIVESAQIDGVNVVQEFIHITLPLIYPTILSFIIIAVSDVMTGQYGLYNLFGRSAGDLQTIGYFLYLATLGADFVDTNPTYGQLSALGLILTCIMVPVTLILRKVLKKVGPSD